MIFSLAESGPRMNVTITPKERAVAKRVKEEFKEAIKELENALKTVLDLRDAVVEEKPSREKLKNTYRGRLVRYRTKIQKSFNIFLTHTREILKLTFDINDPEMERLRDILVAEIDELSDGTESLLDLLKETDRDSFVQTLEVISAQLEKRQKSIEDVIESQVFNHINHDILGKLKISELKFNIKRRSRLLRQLINKRG